MDAPISTVNFNVDRSSDRRARVIYISYTGLLDPLGQSQVLQYVVGLAPDHDMTLITFEKTEALQQTEQLRAAEAACRAANVEWYRLVYHRRPGIPATLYDIAVGTAKAVSFARSKKADVVHCRSYIAGMMGLSVKWIAGTRLVFDMRGFWADERVDGDIWQQGSVRYRFFKFVERQLLINADHVVSLTRAGVREIGRFRYLKDRVPPVSVIPTCTNLEMFRPIARDCGHDLGFILGYVGSAGSWYMFEQVARAVRLLFEARADASFLVINNGDHDAIRGQLREAGVDLGRVTIKAVPFDQVAAEISRMDAGIFFIKPLWSKRASCPTRMGEFLACGRAVLANGGVGDVAEILAETGTGFAIEAFDEATLRAGLDKLIEFAADPSSPERCRKAAEDHFSLADGVRAYSETYRKLLRPPDHR